LNVGEATTLVGKAPSVESIVNDVSAQTNRMWVCYVVEQSGRQVGSLSDITRSERPRHPRRAS